MQEEKESASGADHEKLPGSTHAPNPEQSDSKKPVNRYFIIFHRPKSRIDVLDFIVIVGSHLRLLSKMARLFEIMRQIETPEKGTKTVSDSTLFELVRAHKELSITEKMFMLYLFGLMKQPEQSP